MHGSRKRRSAGMGDRLPPMRIGVLTGGGDCPGLNAVIRAAVTKGVQVYGHEFVGFRDGWKGPLEGLTRPLGALQVEQKTLAEENLHLGQHAQAVAVLGSRESVADLDWRVGGIEFVRQLESWAAQGAG